MKNNKTLVIVTVLIMVISIFALIIVYSVYKDIVGDKKVNEWEELINSKDAKLLYFGREGCTWCKKYKPVLDAIKEKYGIAYQYIDTEKTSGFEELLARLGEDYLTFGTPYTAIVKKGKKVSSLYGYQNPKTLFEFLQNNGIIGKDKQYEEMVIDENSAIINSDKETYPNLNILTYEEYKTLLDRKDKSILVVGQTDCVHCLKYKPILNQIAIENEISINYIDISLLSQKEYEEFSESLSFFESHPNWGTPLTLIIQNKHVIDYLEGAATKTDTINYYQSFGLIK